MKFYLADRQTRPDNAAFDFTGFHAAATAWLDVAANQYVVALPNKVARPGGYRLLGQGPDLAGIPADGALRTLLHGRLGLRQKPRADRLGRVLFECKTLCSPAHNATIEPAGENANLWFDGKLLHRQRFRRTDEEAQPIIEKKRAGYAALRKNKALARKWLHKQLRLGFTRADVQGEFLGDDGGPLKPSTTIIEDGSGSQSWAKNRNGTPDFGDGHLHVAEGPQQYRVLGCDTPVSDGDHRVTATYQDGVAALGIACRMPDTDLVLGYGAYQYALLYSSSSIQLYRQDNYGPGSLWSLGASVATGDSLSVGETLTVQAVGSDVSGDFMGGVSVGPFTDTNAPDTHLYGGFIPFGASWPGVAPWVFTDELGGGGGHVGAGRPHQCDSGTVQQSFADTGGDHE